MKVKRAAVQPRPSHPCQHGYYDCPQCHGVLYTIEPTQGTLVEESPCHDLYEVLRDIVRPRTLLR